MTVTLCHCLLFTMVHSVSTGSKSSDIDHHPGPAIAALMKLSFDEDYRHAICTLGKS